MDYTKTSDNKLTFLHILARAVLSKFPEVLTFADELSDVAGASRSGCCCNVVLVDFTSFTTYKLSDH